MCSNNKPLFPIILDRHDDTQKHINVVSAALKLNQNNLQSIWEFVYRSLNPDPDRSRRWALDQDEPINDRCFICTAMECGLIGDVLIITHQPPTNEPFDFMEYQSLDGVKHTIYYFRYLRSRDFTKKLFGQNQELRALLAKQFNQNTPVVLDIDLDFFTYDDLKGEDVLPFSAEDFKNIFSNTSVLRNLLEKINLITISTEPYWSGSDENSRIVYELLRSHLKNVRLAPYDKISYFPP